MARAPRQLRSRFTQTIRLSGFQISCHTSLLGSAPPFGNCSRSAERGAASLVGPLTMFCCVKAQICRWGRSVTATEAYVDGLTLVVELGCFGESVRRTFACLMP